MLPQCLGNEALRGAAVGKSVGVSRGQGGKGQGLGILSFLYQNQTCIEALPETQVFHAYLLPDILI